MGWVSVSHQITNAYEDQTTASEHDLWSYNDKTRILESTVNIINSAMVGIIFKYVYAISLVLKKNP